MLKDVKLIVAMGNETIYQRDSGFDSTCQRTDHLELLVVRTERKHEIPAGDPGRVG